MRTLNASTARTVVVAGAVAGIVLLGLGRTEAQVAASDETAGYVVFPKVVVDTAGVLGPNTDTTIQITNTDLLNQRTIECTWINATGRCGIPTAGCAGATSTPCDSADDCTGGLQCVPCWTETDFAVTLTPGQPIGFRASNGEISLPCPISGIPPQGCASDNEGAILPAGDPFRGELKCAQIAGISDPTLQDRNDIKGEATIITSTDTELTTAAYNAFGFQFTPNAPAPANSDGPLCLGPALADPCEDAAGCGNNYAACPGVLILDHFFEGAHTPLGPANVSVHTNLTLVPCSENLFGDDPEDQIITTAQFLIYNEFEQRFSSSIRVQCYRDIPLADIDTRPGPDDDAFSVFSAAVQGTATGQTRIRGVAGQEDDHGHGLLGIGHEFFIATVVGAPSEVLEANAWNLHAVGDRAQGDAVCRFCVTPPCP